MTKRNRPILLDERTFSDIYEAIEFLRVCAREFRERGIKRYLLVIYVKHNPLKCPLIGECIGEKCYLYKVCDLMYEEKEGK